MYKKIIFSIPASPGFKTSCKQTISMIIKIIVIRQNLLKVTTVPKEGNGKSSAGCRLGPPPPGCSPLPRLGGSSSSAPPGDPTAQKASRRGSTTDTLNQ